jgi:uncharacterized protein (DUF1501 family)
MGCCDEHTRSEALRRGIALAGSGLPAIEPGMPAPAGTGLDRRGFIARSLGLALSIYGATALVPRALEEGIESAMAAGGPGKVLVSVFLDGGADSLSMLFPANDARYRALRPRLAISPTAAAVPFSEDTRLWWHPTLSPLATLHAEGKVTVLPGIGYTDANQSHFTSRHFWEVGATDERLVTGWMGRYLDRYGRGDNPLQGLSLDWSLQPSLATKAKPVASIDGPDRFGFGARGVWGSVENRMIQAIGGLGSLPTRGDVGLEQATRAAHQSHLLYRQLTPFQRREGGFGSPAPYPAGDDSFPRRLAGLAAMLAAGLPLRCVALTAPGAYDTHDNQAGDLEEGLELTAASLFSFQRDLEARGLADRVITLVWSEFGRRPEENGSNGTDHGAAGIALVLGTHASGRMVGEMPDLTRLDRDGNLRPNTDFRALYRSLIEGWLGGDADGVLPRAKAFRPLPILR